jgi:AbrB family looped-hinge helix DNA binding protein
MRKVGTTKMSSKGQVVIPQKVRNRLGLKSGTPFVVFGQGDLVVLRALRCPTEHEFATMVRKAGGRAKFAAAALAAAKTLDLATSWPRAYKRL